MLPDSCVFIANNIESATISSSNNENEFDVLSDSIDTLTDRLQEEMSEKVIAQKRVNALKKNFWFETWAGIICKETRWITPEIKFLKPQKY